MSIYISNTLNNKKEEFVSIEKNKVGIYVCGPTVYDEPHIGHVRSSLVFEVMRRYFEFSGYEVKYVKNITDVDDKIIDAAAKIENNSKDIKVKVKEIAEKYEKMYHQHMGFLGIKRADVEPKATEHINDMIDMIEEIIKRGYAYESGGNIYFSVRKLKDYGKLSGQDIESLGQQSRLKEDRNKKDKLDFALWKKVSEHEPYWDSPWGKGRPGWHIECSVMSTKYLGAKFDIHCGGRDLIFPHHENEIAQAEAAGKDFANYWMHNGLLTIDGEKMSKSLGNFITIKNVMKKYSSDALDILFLSTHYSKPLDFTWDKLEDSEKAAERLRILISKLKDICKGINNSNESERKMLEGSAKELKQQFELVVSEFRKAMDDDFNTAVALSKVFDLVSYTNKFLDSKEKSLSLSEKKLLLEIKNKLKELGNILCLFNEAENKKLKGIETELLDILIDIRNIARDKKLFDFADIIRGKLKDIGVILEDTEAGTKYRITYKKN